MSDQSGATSRSTGFMPPYPDRFYSAAQYANIPDTVEEDPSAAHAGIFSDLTTLMLYSLYQQVRDTSTQDTIAYSGKYRGSQTETDRKRKSVEESVKDWSWSRIRHNIRSE